MRHELVKLKMLYARLGTLSVEINNLVTDLLSESGSFRYDPLLQTERWLFAGKLESCADVVATLKAYCWEHRKNSMMEIASHLGDEQKDS